MDICTSAVCKSLSPCCRSWIELTLRYRRAPGAFVSTCWFSLFHSASRYSAWGAPVLFSGSLGLLARAMMGARQEVVDIAGCLEPGSVELQSPGFRLWSSYSLSKGIRKHRTGRARARGCPVSFDFDWQIIWPISLSAKTVTGFSPLWHPFQKKSCRLNLFTDLFSMR